MVNKAKTLANQVPSLLAKSCSGVIIRKNYWKNMALSAILQGLNVVTLHKDKMRQLQVIENKVYRTILRAPSYTLTCVLREVGVSAMETRVMKWKMTYLNYIIKKEN